jgi:hypothetical protein
MLILYFRYRKRFSNTNRRISKLIIFIVIALIKLDFISHIKAKKIVKEKMKDSGIDYLIKILKVGSIRRK